VSNGEDDYAADIRSIDYGEGKSPQNVFARAMIAGRPALWGILDRRESHPLSRPQIDEQLPRCVRYTKDCRGKFFKGSRVNFQG